MDNTCGSCVHWDRHSFRDKPDNAVCGNEKMYSNVHAVRTNEGGSVVITETTPIDGVSINAMGTPDDRLNFLKTGKDFGCIHHTKAK